MHYKHEKHGEGAKQVPLCKSFGHKSILGERWGSDGHEARDALRVARDVCCASHIAALLTRIKVYERTEKITSKLYVLLQYLRLQSAL